MPASTNKTVLVVDEDPDLRIFIKALLSSAGYRPVTVDTEAEGLRRCLQSTPSLIILDAAFRAKRGLGLYRDLKTHRRLKDIPVILLSTLSKRTLRHFQILEGASVEQALPEPDGYLDKPPEAEDLMQLVERLTGAGADEAALVD